MTSNRKRRKKRRRLKRRKKRRRNRKKRRRGNRRNKKNEDVKIDEATMTSKPTKVIFLRCIRCFSSLSLSFFLNRRFRRYRCFFVACDIVVFRRFLHRFRRRRFSVDLDVVILFVSFDVVDFVRLFRRRRFFRCLRCRRFFFVFFDVFNFLSISPLSFFRSISTSSFLALTTSTKNNDFGRMKKTMTLKETKKQKL